MSNASASQTQSLPPTPSASPLVTIDRRVSQSWNQWFLQAEQKINVINANLVDWGSVPAVSGLNPGVYGDSSHYPVIEVTANGIISGVSTEEVESGSGGINNQSGTAYTFVLSDNEQTIITSSSSNITLTIPSNANVPFTVGSKVAYTQGGSGTISIVGEAGVIINSANGTSTSKQWDGGVAEKIATDTWQLWNGPMLGTLAYVDDAPSDENTYGRYQGGWKSISGMGGISGVNEQTGTAYTLAVTDATQVVRCTNAAEVTLTVPTNADVALPLYCIIPILQGGVGAVTISGATDVTIESPNGVVTTAQGDFRTLFQRASNVWVIG